VVASSDLLIGLCQRNYYSPGSVVAGVVDRTKLLFNALFLG